jgi:hypothetical protein
MVTDSLAGQAVPTVWMVRSRCAQLRAQSRAPRAAVGAELRGSSSSSMRISAQVVPPPAPPPPQCLELTAAQNQERRGWGLALALGSRVGPRCSEQVSTHVTRHLRVPTSADAGCCSHSPRCRPPTVVGSAPESAHSVAPSPPPSAAAPRTTAHTLASPLVSRRGARGSRHCGERRSSRSS